MKRLFIDMDGCVARFYAEQNYLEEMYEKGFFKRLRPYAKMILSLKKFAQRHPEVELCILSAYPSNSYAEEEKNEWLDIYFPIKKRIFMNVGKSKSSCIPDISKDDFLLDDHTKNLVEWENAGGTGIKVRNEINCKNGTWKGEIIIAFDNSEEIVKKLEMVLGLE